VNDHEILTIDETAKLLKLDSHHVRKLIASGLIPSVRLSPRIIRVPRWLLLKRLEEMAAAVHGTQVDDSV
jgi:excisionase family DNA binding protein